MSIKITWIGHSAFIIESGNQQILLDPFISGNPVATIQPTDVNPTLILLSHAHGDHLGDLVEIAKRTGVPVVGNFEIGNWLLNQGVENVLQGNPGGTVTVNGIQTKWTVAHHSSSFPDGSYGGQPNGFIITIDEKKLYFAGDTSLFGDMQLIGAEGIHTAFLPIGDLFTMGINDSIQAIRLIQPEFVIPMHYNTFPPIEQDTGAWADRVRSETDAEPVVLHVNGSHVT